VILVDANILLYAKIADYPQHELCNRWLDDRLNGSARVGLPWHSLLAFLRISTNPRVFDSPLGIEVAWQQVEEWLSVPTVWIPEPTQQHPEIMGKLIRKLSPSSQLVADTYLAALAIDHGLILCSVDNDFSRFEELSWNNPLSARES
jgi:toxin-antitoxin system PIN domain toxin